MVASRLYTKKIFNFSIENIRKCSTTEGEKNEACTIRNFRALRDKEDSNY